MHQILEPQVVVATAIEAHIDDDLIWMLLLDQGEKPIRLLAEIFIPAKAAIDRVGVGQVGVPEIVVRPLPKQWRLPGYGDPAQL
jgi:hypothetical protein